MMGTLWWSEPWGTSNLSASQTEAVMPRYPPKVAVHEKNMGHTQGSNTAEDALR